MISYAFGNDDGGASDFVVTALHVVKELRFLERHFG